MSNVRKLFRHSSHYFLGQILIMAAGFASFPLYTRLLSVSDYGILGLITTTVMMVVAFSKLGLQHSIVRFYSDFHSDSKGQSVSQFYSTIFFSIIFLGGVSSALLIFTLKLTPLTSIEETFKRLLILASFMILFSVSLQTFNQFFRAWQRPKAYIALGIASKYGSILFSILFFFYFGKILYGIIFGTVIWEGILFIIALIILLRMKNILLKNFSFTLLKEFLKYGFPLIGVELSHQILSFGDRYLIQYFLGAASLGIYSAGYSAATYAAELLTLPIRDAVFPIYMDIYTNKGEEETKIFLEKGLRYFSLIAIPIIFGFSAVSSEVIVILASNKYVQSSIVVPYVVAGLIIYGSWSFFGAGLFLHKKTFTVMVLIAISSVLNVILNIFFLPKLGIMGAALATLLSYAFYISLLIICSFRKLSFKIPYRYILLYAASASIMYIVVSNLGIQSLLIALFFKVVVGILVYALLVLWLDGELREKFVSRLWKRGWFIPEVNRE